MSKILDKLISDWTVGHRIGATALLRNYLKSHRPACMNDLRTPTHRRGRWLPARVARQGVEPSICAGKGGWPAAPTRVCGTISKAVVQCGPTMQNSPAPAITSPGRDGFEIVTYQGSRARRGQKSPPPAADIPRRIRSGRCGEAAFRGRPRQEGNSIRGRD